MQSYREMEFLNHRWEATKQQLMTYCKFPQLVACVAVHINMIQQNIFSCFLGLKNQNFTFPSQDLKQNKINASQFNKM